MGLLQQIQAPADLRSLTPDQLEQLAAEIRARIITVCARNSGHLGPNLGVVELTIALHRVFDSPHDQVVFDTGHQSYVHKLLTGRNDAFDSLRKRDGLSGYPSRAESDHDLVENSHASTSLSYADGLAKANTIRRNGNHVVAVVGDGALTGGMTWEALNNIAAREDNRLVIIVNDNGRSYSPTVGALAGHLDGLRTNPRYEQVLELVRNNLSRAPLMGRPLYDVLHGVKKGLKDMLAPQGMFEDLGLKYLGPVDGHDIASMETALRQARNFDGPVLVHCVTRKGNGFGPAEQDEEDNLHSAAPFDLETGPTSGGVSAGSWTGVFRDELVALGEKRSDLVAITAAMMYPTGLDLFAKRFPDRFFDVGIAEQHAVTSAAGLAMGGLHPVVAVYATFLNRAFDQVLLDVAMHRCGVTFVLDRAGVTGPDGPSHNGMWDMAVLQVVPGLHLAAPRDPARLRRTLGEAIAISDAPSVVRFSKGSAPADIDAVKVVDGVDVLRADAGADVLLLAIGSMVPTCLEVADRLAEHGLHCTVADPVWVKPLPAGVSALAAGHDLVVTVEDGTVVGGVGQQVRARLAGDGIAVPVEVCGIADEFPRPGERSEVLADYGLTPTDLTRRVVEAHARLGSQLLVPATDD